MPEATGQEARPREEKGNDPNVVHLHKVYPPRGLDRNTDEQIEQLKQQCVEIAFHDEDERRLALELFHAGEKFALALSADERSKIVRDVFARVSEPKLALLDVAPRLYVGKKGRSAPRKQIIDFVEDTYSRYIEAGLLTMPELLRLDVNAYVSLARYFKSFGLPDSWIDRGWSIPSKEELVDAVVADTAVVREARRISRAATRRNSR